MIQSGGRVPMFKMQPQRGTLWVAIIILFLGVACYVAGHSDPGNLSAHRTSSLVLAICIVVSGLLLIISTARMWFKHLWHDRYRTRNRSSRSRRNRR